MPDARAALILPAVALAALALTSGTLPAFFSVALLALFAALTGRAALRLARLDEPRGAARVALALGVGLAIATYAAFALGVFGALHPLPVAIVGAALAALALAIDRSVPAWPKAEQLALDERLLVGAIVLLLLSIVPFVPAPETTWDAVWYHLPLARAYATSGSLVLLPYLQPSGYAWVLPEVTFALAMLGGDVEAARYVHFAVGALGVLAVYALGSRLRDRRAGLLAALFWLSMPTVLSELAKAYNDLFPALYAALALLAALAWHDSRRRGLALLSGALAGVALAAKLTALAVVAPLVILAPALWARRRRDRVDLVLAGLAGLAVAAPWYARAYVVTGNPFFPLLNGVFRSPLWEPVDNFFDELNTIGHAPLDVILAPLRLVFDPAPFCLATRPCVGVVPPLVVAAAIVVVVRGEAHGRFVAAVTLLGVILWGAVAEDARHLLSIFAGGVGVLGATLAPPVSRAPRRALAAGLALATLALPFAVFLAWGGVDRVPWRVDLSLQSREAYVVSRLRFVPAYRWMEAHLAPLPPAALVVGEEASVLYSAIPLWLAEWTVEGRAILRASSDEERAALLRAHAFPYVLVDDAARPKARTVALRRFVESTLPLVHAENGIRVYAVP